MNGSHGWGILAIFVVLFDRYARETLSAAYWRAIENPERRPVVVAATLIVVCHLFFKKPRHLW